MVRLLVCLAVLATPLRLLAAADPVPAPSIESLDKAIDAYMDVRKDAARGVPALSKSASPEEIAARQASLAERIRGARREAQPGDVLVTEARPLLRQRLDQVLAQNPASKQKEIATGNPAHEGVPVRVAVNAAYPKEAPRSSVPTAVLAVLPRLPKELEYRFVGDHLLLLDAEADLVVDFMTKAGDDPTKGGATR